MYYDSSGEYVDDDDEVEEAVDLGVLLYRYEPCRRAVSQQLLKTPAFKMFRAHKIRFRRNKFRYSQSMQPLLQ